MLLLTLLFVLFRHFSHSLFYEIEKWEEKKNDQSRGPEIVQWIEQYKVIMTIAIETIFSKTYTTSFFVSSLKFIVAAKRLREHYFYFASFIPLAICAVVLSVMISLQWSLFKVFSFQNNPNELQSPCELMVTQSSFFLLLS